MRNISFALTTEQVRNQTKTVTRRTGWRRLKPGDRLQPVVKGMGLKKGEHVEKIGGPIEVVSASREKLSHLWVHGTDEVFREGFQMSVSRFMDFFVSTHKGVTLDTEVTRIEFKYLEKSDV